MTRALITIQPDGTVEAVDAERVGGIDFLGETTKRRVSRIEPLRPVRRAVFRALRRAFGDEGRVAAWTRTWRGPWKATILATGEQHVALTREACVEWERASLEAPHG